MSASRDLAPSVRFAFGAVLREIRDERGISQDKLAEAADLDRTYPSLIERGLRQPSLAMLFALARGLGVDPCEIVRRVMEHLTPSPPRDPGTP